MLQYLCSKYVPVYNAILLSFRIAGLSGSPFGQTASRFKDSRLSLESPGTKFMTTCYLVYVIRSSKKVIYKIKLCMSYRRVKDTSEI